MEQVKSKKKGIIIAGISAIVLIAVLGISFAFWNYSRTTDNQILVAGDVYMKYTESTLGLSIENAMPSNGPDESKHFDFTIEGRNKYSKPIWYEIVLSQGEEEESKTRLKDEFLRFRLVEIKGEERKVVADNVSYSDLTKGQKIWINTIDAKTDNVEIKYELYMWIAFETKIGNTEGNDYTIEEWNNVYASIKVSVNGDFEEKELPKTGSETIKEAIANHTTDSCKNLTIEEDGITYLSGSNDCINFNYVWYSGKLWRITAIYPDGTMKMITQDAITAITWNANNETYKDSWIYQWLNEDFKDTLYNYQNIIVQNADWNPTRDENITPIKPPTDASADIVTGDVGALNAYEYYQSGKNLSNYTSSYLNIDYYWWLITPYSGSRVRNVAYDGTLSSNSLSSGGYGVRPSVNLKSNIQLSGEGSKTNPFRIKGDNETGKFGELINTRLSGEYVSVDNKVYRIVGIENETTKLTSVDYVKDDSGEVLTKKFGGLGSHNYGSIVNGGNEDYWGAYLNNTWLTSELQNYITDGTYYLGQVDDNVSYKNSICSASNTSEPTSSCAKTSSKWTGLVGLPRFGEMFSAQLGEGYSSSSEIWLINQGNVMGTILSVRNDGNIYASNSTNTNAFGVRPSVNLKSEVKIISGDGMSPDTAYEIEL